MTRHQTLMAVDRLLTIMETLRGPNGCPWDARQTPQSLAPYLLEETHELLEALDRDDPEAIRDELGDVLLQIVFHAAIFNERRAFDFGEVVARIADKLERRHPHVFATSHGIRHDDHERQWEMIKAEEKRHNPVSQRLDDGIPLTLPALQRATKVSARTRRIGMRLTGAINQSVCELATALSGRLPLESPPGERQRLYGELLLALVFLAEAEGLDAEAALRQTLDRLVMNCPVPFGPDDKSADK